MNKRKAAYIWEQNLIENCDRLPAVPGRVSKLYHYGVFLK